MKSNHLVRTVRCQILRPCPSKSFYFIYDLLRNYVLCSESHYNPKNTDCFNDPAFIELFSRLRVNADRFNLDKPNPSPKPSPSSQVGLATPPDTSINLPDIDVSTVVGESNTVLVLHDSTKQGSCDSTPQALAPILGVPACPLVLAAAENKTPTSGASRSKKKKFYLVTRGKRTGMFNNW